MHRMIAALAVIVVSQATPLRAQDVRLVIAQTATPAPSAPAPVAANPNAGTKESSPPTAAAPAAEPKAPDAASKAKVKKALSAPACSIRYIRAKLSGKLNGRKWGEFRREECGAPDINAVFPNAISPKYSGQDPDKARTLTCADQFTANKATNANGGMKWIEKDGGYYGECVSRLKS